MHHGLVAYTAFVILAFSAICTPHALAQGTPQGAPQALTVNDVVSMLEAQLPEQVVLARLKAHGKPFQLSTEDLVRLKKAGATESVMVRMMDPSGGALANAAPATAPPAPAGPPAVEGFSFTEVGVYAKKGGQWVEALPEIVNWKTGGVLKNIASVGVVKKDVNGHIPGEHSRNSVATPFEFMICVPEGVAITEYQLIHLRAKPGKNYREFRTVTGGVFNAKSGAMRDMVPFEGKKVANRLYSVVLPSTLGAGEYGFIYLGASGGAGGLTSLSMGKMYTFRLLE
jgi:hypothetical protein